MDFSLELLPSCFKLGQNAKAKILVKMILTAWRQKRRRPCADPGQPRASAIQEHWKPPETAIGKGRGQVSPLALISDFWPSEPILSHASFYSIPRKLLYQLCSSDLCLLAVRYEHMDTYWLIIICKSAHLTWIPFLPCIQKFGIISEYVCLTVFTSVRDQAFIYSHSVSHSLCSSHCHSNPGWRVRSEPACLVFPLLSVAGWRICVSYLPLPRSETVSAITFCVSSPSIDWS